MARGSIIRHSSRVLAVLAGILLVPACGSANKKKEPTLGSKLVGELYYTSPTRCGQGPFDIDVEALGGRWGESVELRIGAPRRVRLTVALIQDGKTIEQKTVYAGTKQSTSTRARDPNKPDNERCVAGAIELDASLSGGGGSTGGGGGEHPVKVPVGPGNGGRPPTTGSTPGAALTAHSERPPSHSPRPVLGKSWWNDDPDAGAPLRKGQRLRIRLWSTVPNDLEGVVFTVVRTARRPNVDEATYIAHVRAERAARAEHIRRESERHRLMRERQQAEAERRWQEAEKRRREEEARRPPPRRLSAAELAERKRKIAEERERRRLENERRREEARRRLERERRRREKAARRSEETRRRRLEAGRRREAYCAAHKKDTDCWGPGGFTVHSDLARRAAEKDKWCKDHPEEARCWSKVEWTERRFHWQRRIQEAEDADAQPPQPTGPPPPRRAEKQPPKPSENAEWRPGYWHWNGKTWNWLAGLWRVPESDIAAELTVKAPSEAPEPKEESAPAPPAPTAVWVAGYWQWDGAAWVWVPGSWQIPPGALMEWRPPTWKPKAGVQIFVPGGWIKITGSR